MSLTIQDRERLKRILDLSDRLGRLRRRLKDAEHLPTATELREEVRSIAGSVVSIGLPGVLGRLADDRHLSPQEVMVLLILLNRRIEGGGNPLTGREILTLLFPSAYGILSGAALLAAGAPLRVCGAVTAVEPDADDVLESRYRLGDELFRAIERDARPRPDGERRPAPYRGHFEYLAELGRLTTLLFRRANAAFEVDPFGHHAFEETESAAQLDRRAGYLADRVRTRLAATERGESFPLVALARRLHLAEDEQLILVALLVQECLYGNPGIESVDLVRMVARSEEDVLRKRALLEPGGRLRREGLVEVPVSPDDGGGPPEVVLPRWVVSTLLGERERVGSDAAFDPDARLEFHEYLKGLDDSDRFFRDLGE
ncbi:MAG: hypothetical protein MUE73_03855 [Planctomycetes bacterium]|nr:hypothetical protein [Planctomycetota bacterium]